MKKYHYSLYGLTIDSDFECPLLPRAEGSEDIIIHYNQKSPLKLGYKTHSPLTMINPDNIILDVKGIARYQLLNNKELVIEQYPSSRTDMVRLFLLGSAMGMVLHKKNYLPLHGCGILHDDQAILFLGRSGIGKSTLSLLFSQKGFRLIGDDVCALKLEDSMPPLVYPASPSINLCEDVAKNMAGGIPKTISANSNNTKFVVPLEKSFHNAPANVKKIYFLTRNDKKEIILHQDLDEITRVKLLHLNTYRKRFPFIIGGEEQYFRSCAELAKCVPLKLVSRPDDFSRIRELPDFLEKDFYSE